MLNGLIVHFCSMFPGNGAGEHGGRPKGARDVRRACAPGRRAGRTTSPRPSLRNRALTFWLGAALLLVGATAGTAHAFSASNGDQIVNSATFTADGGLTATASVSVTLLIHAQSTIAFLKYAAPLPGGSLIPGSSLMSVAAGSYRTGSDPSAPFAPEQNPVPLGATTPLDLASPLPLMPAALYHAGEPMFVQVTDPEQNLDKNTRETLSVTLTDSATGEVEVLRLTETGPDTGIFLGYINSTGASGAGAVSYGGSMAVAQANSIAANYVNALDGTNSTAASVVVDPLGIVFDSVTGKPLDGVSVTLFDVNANRPATVYGDNGVSSFPATVLTGSTPKDGSGRVYAFPPGGFRFPFIAPGSYQFRVTPPAGYLFPTATTDAALAVLPGGPFTVVTGSRGEQFLINPGPAVRLDIPLDPTSGVLWVQKSAGKSQVAAGDMLPYQINVQNLQTDARQIAAAVVLTDRLPLGFRYRKGSTVINLAAAADPTFSADGRTLSFAIGDLAPKATLTLSYVVEIAAGAATGLSTNTVSAASGSVVSNLASATVEVRSDFLATRSLVLGRVYNGSCSDRDAASDKGLAGVRIYLEDGTFVDTDKRGMYHFEGVTPTSHVVQLDLDSLPQGYLAVPCEENSRFAGRAYSQFVDLQGGTMWRADFHVARKQLPGAPGEHAIVVAPPRPEAQAAPGAESEEGSDAPAPPTGSVSIDLKSALKGGALECQVRVWGGAEQLSNKTLKITLPAGVSYLPGSSELDGIACGEPRQEGNTLSYQLGDSAQEWIKILRFRADPRRAGTEEELLTSAVLNFDTPAAAGLATPRADNTLHLVHQEEQLAIPEIVMHPHFPSFGAELSAEDRSTLDELARLMTVLDIGQISVSGYTDTVRIAPRSREVYPDNTALSLARAQSVGRYLLQRLHLPPSKLNLFGFGEKRPIASNRSAEGRAQNRRVEIRVRAARLVQKDRPELVKEQSGFLQLALAPAPAHLTAPVPEAAPALTPVGAAAAAQPDDANRVKEPEGMLSPVAGNVLIYSINGVRVCLNSSLTPRLSVDGKEVPSERIGFTLKDPASGKSIYSYIGVDFGAPGEHTALIEGLDPFGNPRFKQEVKVKRSGAVAALRLKNALGNIADGKTPVRLQLELLDASGNLIPAAAELEILEGSLKPFKKEGETAEPKTGPAERVHVDGQGCALFQPVNKSGSYRMILAINGTKLEVETYVKPVLRDWILVGLAEGSAGYNTVSGHLESAKESGLDDKLYDNDRVAFYAKGTVKGEWLLTASYDSAKTEGATGNGLFQNIDPNTYYTLYGDASSQQYDASSVKKLYLKLERDQFYAMFGDFDTGLTVTELSRYSRRLNGVKTEMNGKNLDFTGFASETGQSYVKDEIAGDGTSGLYHLSRKGIVINSDKVTIQVRDRFQSEVIISSSVLSRFTDYSIDFDAGTILFKNPVYNRDDQFNPIFIVAEYETNDSGTSALTYGGRVGVKLLDQKLKAGITYIHEGQVSGKGDSLGVDTVVTLAEGTTFKAEAARTESNFGTAASGNAYLAELARKSAGLDSRVYYREIEGGFGLGQQQGSEVGTRKIGADAAYKLSSTLTLNAQASRQYNLLTGAQGDLVEAKGSYSAGNYGASLGLRHASDQLTDGTTQTSDQFTAGASYLALNKRLTLKLDRDQSIGSDGNANYPTRTVLGADFKLTDKVSLFAQEELTGGSSTQSNTTRAGLKSTPWQGGSVSSSLERNLTENDDRLFALFGLKQTWKLNEHWTVDGGMDRNQTLKSSYSLNLNATPASGGEDFTAVSVGADYKQPSWSWNGRGEVRNATSQDKYGVLTSLLGEPAEGWGWSARLQLFQTTAAAQDTVSGDLRFGLVYRPLATRWIVLDRLDLLIDRQSGSGSGTDTDNRRAVNNLNANFRPDRRSQLSLQYGAKYVLESVNGAPFSGYTDLVGVEGRYDLTKSWDLGLRGSLLHTWSSGQVVGSSGLSVGYNIVENAWLSLGYNLIGFSDKDFSVANYTAQGPYVRFRFKFDQNSVKDAVKWVNQ